MRTSDPEIKGEPASHPLDPKVFRYRTNLGDRCGLTQGGVHLTTLPPNNISTVPHWHSNEDEWFYVIKAGEGARIVLYEDGATEPKEEEVKTGDFFGFPAATKTGHAFKTGADEMIYLLGGSRRPIEIAHYPALKMKAIIDRSSPGAMWGVKEEHLITRDLPSKK